MIEIARVILWWILHALLWGSEFIVVALLMAWLYYVIVLEPRIRRKKQTALAAEPDRPALHRPWQSIAQTPTSWPFRNMSGSCGGGDTRTSTPGCFAGARQIFIVPRREYSTFCFGSLRGRKMKPGHVDQSSILDRILDTAADNLRVAKILIPLGLDPNNVTYDAIFNRVLEILVAQITLANMCALLGSLFFVTTLLMRTMMALRTSNMISDLFFMAFGALAGDTKTFLLYLLMLPINSIRCANSSRWRETPRTATSRWNG
jgi:hypothetical protein